MVARFASLALAALLAPVALGLGTSCIFVSSSKSLHASVDIAYAPRPLAQGETGYAIRCAKLVTMDEADRVFDPGMVIVRDGKIEYVGAPLDVPEGLPLLDQSDKWVSPGMVDLHSHVQTGGWGDINDMVRPNNPDLTVSATVRPSNDLVKVACAGGVTTMLGIPGSGTSIGGFGILWKSKTDADFDEVVLRDPGGMKSAFNYNPQRGGNQLGGQWAGLSWMTQRAIDRARGYLDRGEEPPFHLRNLVKVLKGELPVLVHCASAEGVAGVVRLWKIDNDTKCIVSHGSWDGHYAGAFCAEHGVPVNHGPRTINFTSMVREDKIVGGAASYVAQGVPLFSLNTDAPVMPQEELFLQGSMSARFGADAYQMLRAVTTHPAESILVGHRVGSLETGKDADLVISLGDPLDPRSAVEMVLIDGEIQYSRSKDGQWF